MAVSGCPDTDSFPWLLGSRYQDMEDTNHNSFGSKEFHLNAVIAKDIGRWFCIKPNTSIDTNRSCWPPGIITYEMHLTLILGTLYKTDLFVVFI